ncbi:hypothetical protein [Marinimicrobium sp. ABcell2]|uniref:hypothetical protein n=1 Tax=Marinimicrobium sp. ABcell2 TaxID=3069751 RepID=UPI0027B509B0|nr:hypothetical protein [Marinimicrobium sp. ABcell2]MDQ2077133.1 hypothetical protein [Marinimicrobium sp. ABcell2]
MKKNNDIRRQGLGVAFLLICLGLLVACSGSSSGDSDPNPESNSEPNSESNSDSSSGEGTGVFIDSPVEGLTYKTDSGTGTTDEQGRFEYEPGEIVTFFIGETSIGVAPGAAVVTPYDLVESADEEELSRAINIARLLQSLDDDLDPDTGIRLIPEAKDLPQNLDFRDEFTLADALGQVRPGVALVDAETAQAHLDASVAEAVPLPEDQTFHAVTHGQWVGNLAPLDTSCMDDWNDVTVTMTQQADGRTHYEGSMTGAQGLADTFAFSGRARNNSVGQSQGGEYIHVGLYTWIEPGGLVGSGMVLDIGDRYGCITRFVLKGENAENQLPVSYVSQTRVGICTSEYSEVRWNEYTINSYDIDGYIPDAPVYYEIRNGQESGPFPMTAECIGNDCERFNDRPSRRIDRLTIDDLPCFESMDRTIEIEVTDNEGGSRRVRIATADEGQGEDVDIGDSAAFQFCADDYPVLYCDGVREASDQRYWFTWSLFDSCSDLYAETDDIGLERVVEDWSGRDDTAITLPNGDVVDPEPRSPDYREDSDSRGSCCISTEYEGCPQ